MRIMRHSRSDPYFHSTEVTIAAPRGTRPGITIMFISDMEMASNSEERRHLGLVFNLSLEA